MLKKIVLRSLIAVVALIVIILVINQIDSAEPEWLFTELDLNEVTAPDEDNGFYLILGFMNKPEKDPMSQESIELYKKLVTDFIPFNEAEKQLVDYTDEWHIDFKQKINEKNLIESVIASEGLLYELKTKHSVLLERYNKLLNMEKIQDFSKPSFVNWTPRYYTILKTVQLYCYLAILEANKSGNWDLAVKKVLRSLDCTQKWRKTSRALITYSISTGSFRVGLVALNNIITLKKCSASARNEALKQLKQYKNDGVLIRNSIVTEYLSILESIYDERFFGEETDYLNWIERLQYKLTFQRHRTHKIVIEDFKVIVERMNIPPFKREEYEYKGPTGNMFWWVQNYHGKMMVAILLPNLDNYTLNGHRFIAFIDVSILQIEAMNENVSSDEMQDWLNKKGQEYLNPFTGNPYEWSMGEKSIIFEFTVDKKEGQKKRILVPVGI